MGDDFIVLPRAKIEELMADSRSKILFPLVTEGAVTVEFAQGKVDKDIQLLAARVDAMSTIVMPLSGDVNPHYAPSGDERYQDVYFDVSKGGEEDDFMDRSALCRGKAAARDHSEIPEKEHESR